jgi:segregation and condensation protein B
VTRRKPTKGNRGDRTPVSATITPPPLDPGDVGEPDGRELERVHDEHEGAEAEEEVQLDLSLAVPPDEGEEPEVAADTGHVPPGPADASADDGGEAPAEAHGADGHGDLDAHEIEAARDLTREHLRGLLEALIFAADKPMSTGELAKMASAPLKQVRAILGELKPHYAGRGIVLDEVAGGWLFRTSVQFAPFVRELASERPVKLTRAQVETLAIAAYRQPITRPEIDEIRGVDSGATLKLLLERDLVRILGKKDEPGRPLLYGTTTHFLEFFGLKSLKDLPTLREFTELSDESRRVAEAELGDVLGEAAIAPRAAVGPLATPRPEAEVEPLDPESSLPHEAPPIGFDGGVAHDTVVPPAPPTGEVVDPEEVAEGGDADSADGSSIEER